MRRLILFGLVVLALTACNTTPTAVPVPTLPPQPPAQTPIGVQPTVPSAPSSPVPAGPTATKFAVAVEPSATPVPPAPTVVAATKASAPTGRIAYSIATGDAPKFHTIWVANVNGSNAREILTHAYWPALSPDGTRIAYYGRPEGRSEGLYLANSDGGNQKQDPIVIGAGVCCMDWSRDGNWIVYAVSGRPNQPGGPLWKLKMDGFYQTRIELGVAGNGPAFSPDGKQIAYSGSQPGSTQLGLMLVSADGGAPRQITTDNGGNAQWSPRGDKLVYQARDGAGMQIFTVNPDGSGKKQMTRGSSNDAQPVFSRDGGTIFWRSDQNGKAWAIFAMNADGTNARKLIDNTPPDPNFWGWESLSVSP